MKILQLSISYPLDTSSLDSDLAEALAAAGHKITVVSVGTECPKADSPFAERNGVRILRVNTPQIQKTRKIKKGLSFLSIPLIVKRAIKKYLAHDSFGLVLFEAPPVMFHGIVKWAMKHFNCPSYLMQKDIFPQNAVDLGFFSKNSLAYLYFRRQEKSMLKTASKIGCMSEANIAYLLEHNDFLKDKTVELFPNTKKIAAIPQKDKVAFKKKFGIPSEACTLLFGGNMGKPQQMPLMIQAIENFANDPSVFFIFAGSGTEASKVKNFISKQRITNAKFLHKMPRAEYEAISINCDVGLVTLDYRYTIPNYPSKTLSYMECAMPIIAATDTHTDYRNLIVDLAKCGLWSNSEIPQDFFDNIKALAGNRNLRKKLGANGRDYLEKNFCVERSVKILEGHFSKS